MRITIINVGYGDAILFQGAEGFTALLDGGSALDSEFAGDPYRIRAAEYLKREAVTELDAVFISHIHEDHVCGLEAVFDQCGVKQLYVPYPVEPFLRGCALQPAPDAFRSVPLYTNALNAYRRLLLRAEKSGTPITVVKPGDTLSLSQDLTAQVLAPKPGTVEAYMTLVEEAYRECLRLPRSRRDRASGKAGRRLKPDQHAAALRDGKNGLFVGGGLLPSGVERGPLFFA